MKTPKFTMPATLELANAFNAGLARQLTADQLNECRRLNAAYGPSCPSHDYCDANVIMAEAFESLTGIAPDDTNPALDGAYMPGMTDEVGALWNAAWTLARANNYRVINP